jgi:hypothetical protein
MKLWSCDCDATYYSRVKRRSWMRLLPGRGLYRCHSCEALMLLPADRVELKRQEDSRLDDEDPATTIPGAEFHVGGAGR